MNSRGLLSMESVISQFPLVYKQLVIAFGKLSKNSGTNDFIDVALEVQGIVSDGTDMSVRLIFDDIGEGAYIVIPDLTAQHALLSDQTFDLNNVDGLTLIRKAKTAVKGGYDNKRNRVTGVFKDIVLSIHVPKKDITEGYLTAEETTAGFLHELGHGAVYFEYLTRTCTTNQILAGLAKGLDGSDTPGNKEMLLTEVAKTVGLSEVDIKSLAKTTDSRVLNTVVITALHKQYAKETGYDIYDHTANEALADQYATRMGAGKSLVTGLDKIYRRYDNMAYRTTHTYLLIEAVKVSVVILTPFFAVTAPAGFTGLAGYLGLVGMFMILSDATEFGMAGRYDMPGDRFKRIRAQFVEKLKNKNLAQAERESVLADIDLIDSVIGAVNDRRQFFGVLQDFLFSSRRFNRDMKLLQQSLEKLAANDLFVASARIAATAQA